LHYAHYEKLATPLMRGMGMGMGMGMWMGWSHSLAFSETVSHSILRGTYAGQ